MGVNRLGPKKIGRIARETGLDVVRAWATGGSDHTVILQLRDGTGRELLKDGTVLPIQSASIPR